jgi:histone deacetylase complex regulatory component SIN3
LSEIIFSPIRITSEVTLEKVTVILQDYPALLAQFTAYLPQGTTAESASPMKPSGSEQQPGPMQFSTALNFVNKVKKAYLHQPQVYESFLSTLRNYQRGLVSPQEVQIWAYP